MAEVYGYIYAITNTVNGKVYLGRTLRIRARWNEHRSDLRCDTHRNPKLQNAWNKYGEEAFAFSVVARAKSATELNDLECSLIVTMGAEYNLKSGGYFDHHSEESRKKIGDAARGHKRWLGRRHTPETIAKMCQRTMSQEVREHLSRVAAATRLKMSEAQKGNSKSLGNKHTPEARKKMSDAALATWALRKGRV